MAHPQLRPTENAATLAEGLMQAAASHLGASWQPGEAPTSLRVNAVDLSAEDLVGLVHLFHGFDALVMLADEPVMSHALVKQCGPVELVIQFNAFNIFTPVVLAASLAALYGVALTEGTEDWEDSLDESRTSRVSTDLAEVFAAVMADGS